MVRISYFTNAWYVETDLGIEYRKSCNLINVLICDRNAAKFGESINNKQHSQFQLFCPKSIEAVNSTNKQLLGIKNICLQEAARS